MRITLENSFHGTETTLIAKNNQLNRRQAQGARKRLCGAHGCLCGNDFGQRGLARVATTGEQVVITPINSDLWGVEVA